MQPIRIAVIGTGYLGRFHTEKLNTIPTATLTAVVDLDYARAHALAAPLGVPAYTNYRDLLGGVDAVSIASSTPSHFTIAQFFLEHGVHVMVEKPITMTTTEADTLITTADNNRCLLQVGHIEQFNPVVCAARSLIKQPDHIAAIRRAPFSSRSAVVDVVLDIMIHDLELIQSFIPSTVTEISAHGASIITEKTDIAHAHLRFANGSHAHCTASRTDQISERRIRLQQHHSFLDLNLQQHQLTSESVDRTKNPAKMQEKSITFTNYDALTAQLSAFIESIINNSPVLVNGTRARNALHLAHAVRTSIASQHILSYDEHAHYG